MKRLILFAFVLIVGGLALQPAPVRAQESSSCANAPTQQFRYRAGWDVIVAVSDDDPRPNNLRERPWPTARVVMQIPVGDQMILTGESVCSHGLRWWPIAILKNGVTTYGWTVDGEGSAHYLELVSQTNLSATSTLTPRATATPAPATATPVPVVSGSSCEYAPAYRNFYQFSSPTRVRVTAVDDLPLNLRERSDLGSDVVAQIPVGRSFTITGRYVCAQGYRWWPARYLGRTGWVGDGVMTNGESVYYLELAGNG